MNIWGDIRKILVISIDVLLFLVFAFVVFIIVSGGYSLVVSGVNLSAHTTSNPAKILMLLLLVRRLVDLRIGIGEVPLVKILRRIVLNQRAIFRKPSCRHLIVLVSLYTIIIGVIVVMRHNSFNSTAQDLGIFDQLLWNVKNGHGLYSSILDNRHFFGEHFSPVLYPLTGIYYIWTDARALLVFQTLALASGAIPIWWLAKKQLENTNWAMIFAMLYLSYPALRGVNLYDFHPVALVTPLLLFAFWYLHEHDYRPFFAFLLAAFLCKEEVTEIVFIFGIYIALFHKRRILGLSLAVAGVVLFFLIVGTVIPHFRGEQFGFFHRYGYLGDNFGEILTTLIKRPLYVFEHVFTAQKAKFIKRIFGPLGFLSILSPSHLLLALPTFFQNILSSLKAQYSIQYQYTSPLTPFVFISAVFGLKNLLCFMEKTLKRLRCKVSAVSLQPAVAVVLLLFGLMFFGTSPIGKFREYLPTEHTHDVREFLRLVPSHASVCAHTTFVPHLSHRQEIYMFPRTREAEYIMLDSSDRWPLKKSDYFKTVRKLMDKGYGIVSSEGTLLLLSRTGAPSDGGELPADFVNNVEDK